VWDIYKIVKNTFERMWKVAVKVYHQIIPTFARKKGETPNGTPAGIISGHLLKRSQG
jgi:hypothetical protein